MRHIYLLFLFFLLGCTTTRNYSSVEMPVQQPKNIILLIGDGMGLNQVSAGIIVNGSLNIERFPVIGLHKNSSYDNLVTDSAAGATAFSAGVKTYNGAIGVGPDTMDVETILEQAVQQGMKTGLVASSTIVHATPASFASHNKLRNNYEEIALDMANSGVDLMIGGGKKFFDRRTIDSLDLYEMLRAKGYVVSDYFSEEFEDVDWSVVGDKFVYLTSDNSPLSKEAGRTYLVPAAEKAINFMSTRSDENGFFLMIEGSQIDWAGHANNFPYMVSELLEFDQVVKAALDFAEQDGNTLVVLTADHETGGLAIDYGSRPDSIVASFTSDYHTASMIPVYAYGPMSSNFAGIYENTEIYHKMVDALNLTKEVGEKKK